jgi:hypothetical protein
MVNCSDLLVNITGTLNITTYSFNQPTPSYTNTSLVQLTQRTAAVLWGTALDVLLGGHPRADSIVIITLSYTVNNSRTSSAATIYPIAFANQSLPNPGLQAVNARTCLDDAASVCFEVAALQLAAWVQMTSSSPGRFSANGFAVPPGVAQPVRFTGWGQPVDVTTFVKGLELVSVYDVKQTAN